VISQTKNQLEKLLDKENSMSSPAKKNLPIEFEEYRHKVEAILSEQLEFIRRRLTPQHWSFKIENVV
jgi:hypothetical protein